MGFDAEVWIVRRAVEYVNRVDVGGLTSVVCVPVDAEATECSTNYIADAVALTRRVLEVFYTRDPDKFNTKLARKVGGNLRKRD
jgi:hypothetical protein